MHQVDLLGGKIVNGYYIGWKPLGGTRQAQLHAEDPPPFGLLDPTHILNGLDQAAVEVSGKQLDVHGVVGGITGAHVL